QECIFENYLSHNLSAVERINMLKSIYSKLIRYLTRNHALFARLWLTALMNKNAMQRFVLVYTMGKVGSSSIANSLRNQLRERSVYSVHWLNESNLQTDKEFHKKLYDINRKKGVRLNVLPEYIISGFYVNKLIKNNK